MSRLSSFRCPWWWRRAFQGNLGPLDPVLLPWDCSPHPPQAVPSPEAASWPCVPRGDGGGRWSRDVAGAGPRCAQVADLRIPFSSRNPAGVFLSRTHADCQQSRPSAHRQTVLLDCLSLACLRYHGDFCFVLCRPFVCTHTRWWVGIRRLFLLSYLISLSYLLCSDACFPSNDMSWNSSASTECLCLAVELPQSGARSN